MSPVSLGSFVRIFLSSGARIAPSATGTVYDLPVRVSFISSALPDGAVAAADGLAEFPDATAGAGLAFFFLGAAGGGEGPLFRVPLSSWLDQIFRNADAGGKRAGAAARLMGELPNRAKS